MKRLTALLLVITAHQLLMAQNIGIGVTNPAYKLDVGARMRIRTGTIGNASTSSGIWLEDYRDGTNQVFIGMQDSIRAGFYGSVSGVGWALNFNSTNGNVGMTTGMLGIGTSTPLYDVHILRDNPSIGFYDDADSHLAGLITGDSINLFINAYRKPSLGSNVSGNIILQSNTTRSPFLSAGNVGIGQEKPDVKLHISGGTNIGAGSGGYFQLGSSTSGNLAFDINEIQARNNGVAAELTLQNYGGGLQIGSGSTVVNITSAGKLNRNGITSTADMLPICYGKVSAGGVILSSTGNYSVVKNPNVEGLYSISITGENISASPNNYVIIISPTSIANTGGFKYVFASSEIQTTGNIFNVQTRRFQVDYINISVPNDCNPLSCEYDPVTYLTNMPSERGVDAAFNFLVYKVF